MITENQKNEFNKKACKVIKSKEILKTEMTKRFSPSEKNCFRMDITQCLYHTYLTEAGCPELNVLFCENDIYAYGNLPGIKFTRTKTIGAGDELCDFKMELL